MQFIQRRFSYSDTSGSLDSKRSRKIVLAERLTCRFEFRNVTRRAYLARRRLANWHLEFSAKSGHRRLDSSGFFTRHLQDTVWAPQAGSNIVCKWQTRGGDPADETIGRIFASGRYGTNVWSK